MAIRLPKVESGYGVGVSLGYSGAISHALGYSAELSFTRSAHKARLPGVESDATLNGLSLAGRLHFSADKRAQPFVTVGFVWPDILSVTKDSVTVTNPNGTITSSYNRVRILGVSAKAEGGVAFYLNRRFSISGAAAYRVGEYYRVAASIVRSSSTENDTNKGASGNGLTFDVSIRFTL